MTVSKMNAPESNIYQDRPIDPTLNNLVLHAGMRFTNVKTLPSFSSLTGTSQMKKKTDIRAC